MSESVPAAINHSLSFAPGISVADRLASCKAYLHAEGLALRARHEAGAAGLEVARQRSATIDHLLKQLFALALGEGLGPHCYLAARGGLNGRGC
jgi:hypothetical protein